MINYFSRILLFALCLILKSFSVQASPLTLDEIKQRVRPLLASEQGVLEARTYLQKWITYFEQEPPDVKAQLETPYYYLALGYALEALDSKEIDLSDSFKKSLFWIHRLVDEFKESIFIADAYYLKGILLAKAGQSVRAIQTYQEALSILNSKNKDQAKSLEIIRAASKIYYTKQDLKGATIWFDRLLYNPLATLQDKAFAHIALMEQAINEGRFKLASAYLVQIKKNDFARYSLRLNLNLIRAGDALIKQERFLEAMFFYRFVIDFETLLDWNKQYIEEQKERQVQISSSLGNPTISTEIFRVKLNIIYAQQMLEQIYSILSYSNDFQARLAGLYWLEERFWEAFWVYRKLTYYALKHPKVDAFAYRTALLAHKLGLLDELIELRNFYFKQGWYTHQSKIDVLLCDLYLKNQNFSQARSLAMKTLETYSDPLREVQLLNLIASSYIEQKDYSTLLKQFTLYLKKTPNRKASEAIYYWLAYAHDALGNFNIALGFYNTLLDVFKEGDFYSKALFKKAILYLNVGNYAGASKFLEDYVFTYPNTSIAGEIYYLLAYIDEQSANYSSAIKHYQNATSVSREPNFLKDVYFSWAKLLESQDDYQGASSVYEIFSKEISLPSMQIDAFERMANIRFLQNDPLAGFYIYDKLILEYGTYKDSDTIDFVLENYWDAHKRWKILTKEAVDFLEKLYVETSFRKSILKDVSVYFDYIKEHTLGDYLNRQFYDKEQRVALLSDKALILKELDHYKKLRTEILKISPQESFETLYQKSFLDLSMRSLALRLYRLFDLKQIYIKEKYTFSYEDLNQAPPSVILWIGNQWLVKNQQRARGAFEFLLEHYPTSRYALDAWVSLADLDLKKGNAPIALERYQYAHEKFSQDPRVAIAILKQADTLIELGQFTKAYPLYDLLYSNFYYPLNLRAEALLNAGIAYYREFQFEASRDLFERLLIEYNDYPKWLSKGHLYMGRLLQAEGKVAQAKEYYRNVLKDSRFSNDVALRRGFQILP